MMSYSRSRAIFLISTTLLLPLSLIIIILYSLNLRFIFNPMADFGNLVINFDDQSYPVLWIFPDNLFIADSKLGLAFGAISLVVSLACVIFAVLLWPDEKRTYPISPITTLSYALILNALLSLITMIYLQVAYLRSSVFEVGYRSPYDGVTYDIGSFNFESWACQISSYNDEFPRSQCSEARGGRIVVIVCCVATIAAAAIGAWALRGERETIVRAKIEKGKRREFWINGEMDMY